MIDPPIPRPKSPPTPQVEKLAKLRSDLRHFDESEDVGENPSVRVIREHLVRRISELESALCRTKDLQSAITSPHETPE